MIELAALCIIVVVGIPLALFAIWAAGCLAYGAVMACAYLLASPFWLAYQCLVMLAHLVSWLCTQLYAAATNPGWRQSFLRLLDRVGSTGIKAYRLAQRLAAR